MSGGSAAAGGSADRAHPQRPVRIRGEGDRERVLVGRAALEKRISRGKKVLAGARRLFDLSDADFTLRLATVRRALYLLFNEGYHGASGESAVRVERCTEAMRLTSLLREYAPAASPETDALGSLMCLHVARLPARLEGLPAP